MIASEIHSRDLIGYLWFDVVARQATLVVCGRRGEPLREVSLVPVGVLGRLLVRLAIWLGHYRMLRRAIACDDCDRRDFRVWMSGPSGVVVSDARGERWLRSVDRAAVRPRDAGAREPAPNPVIRHFGEPSRN